jgi:hypothetical protein
MQIFLPKPHINQQKILECDKRFRVVMCGRRFGKSELSQILSVAYAVKGYSVAYITPTYGLAKVFFGKLTDSLELPKNKSDLKIDFPNGGQIELFTDRKSTRLNSSH